MPLKRVLIAGASNGGSNELDRIVDRLLNKRIVDSKLEYLVRWKGFNADWDTWEPVENLGNCITKIKKFERQIKFVRSSQAFNESDTNMGKKDPFKVVSTKIKKNAKNIALLSKKQKQVKSGTEKKATQIKSKIDKRGIPKKADLGKLSPDLISNSSPKLVKESQTKTKAAKFKKNKKSENSRSATVDLNASNVSDAGNKKQTPKPKLNKSDGTLSETKKKVRGASTASSKKLSKGFESSAKLNNSSSSLNKEGRQSIETQTPIMKIKGIKRKSIDESSPKGNKKLKGDTLKKSTSDTAKKTTITYVTVSPKNKSGVKSNLSYTVSPNTNSVPKTLPLPKPKNNVNKSSSENKLQNTKKIGDNKLLQANKLIAKSKLKSSKGKLKVSKSLMQIKKNSNKSWSGDGGNDSSKDLDDNKGVESGVESKDVKKSKQIKSKTNKSKSDGDKVSAKKSKISPVLKSSFNKTHTKSVTPPSLSKKKKEQFKLSVANLIGLKKKDQQNGSALDNEKTGPSIKSKTFGKPSTDETKKKSKDVEKAKQTKTSKKKQSKEGDLAGIADDDSDDDDILYSLSDAEDSAIKKIVNSSVSQSKGSLKTKVGKSGNKDVNTEKNKKKSVTITSLLNGSPSPKSKKIRLLDSLKQTSPNRPVRPVSPTMLYTAFKHSGPLTTGIPTIAPPTQAHLTWAVPQEGNVLPSSDTQASLPISPASMSYKVLLENLPHQLHPKKSKKNGTEEDEDIERRISVRASECAFKYKEILIKKCNRYTQIWLNTHTKMKNAINPQVVIEITSALNAAKYDDSNLVMFSGLGNVFCSGVDLHYLTTGDKKAAAKKMAEAMRELVRKFITFPKLLVAVVTGPAIGLGSALLPLCDIVYASDKASFYMPYGELSQTPEGCASFTLPECVGIAMANELMIGGRKITAIEACQLGIVSQVYWPTSMMQEVIPRVQHMALLSGKVLETTKLLMRSQKRPKLEHTNESECDLLVERWASSECQRSIEQYLSNERNYML